MRLCAFMEFEVTFEEKLGLAKEELKNTGLWKSNYDPPLLRLYHKLGLKAKPPHYANFVTNLIVSGLYFGIFWGLAMWFFFWRSTERTLAIAIIASVVAGALFGLLMACYYKYSASKHKLSNWDNLGNKGA